MAQTEGMTKKAVKAQLNLNASAPNINIAHNFQRRCSNKAVPAFKNKINENSVSTFKCQ